MSALAAAPVRNGDAVDPAIYARALLNVLADFGDEKTQLQGTQKAILNILDDAHAEARRLHDIHGAMLNLLDDSESDNTRLAATERAVLNILDDSESDKAQLAITERAAVNILEDSEQDKAQLLKMHRAALNILDDFESEKNELRDVQRASLNILEDIDLERSVRRQVEEQVRALNEDLEARVLQRTEALTLANQELEAFAYSVAHDLRAPLRAIDGFSQIILEDQQEALDEGGLDALRRVREAAQRMGFLIDDMLTLAHSTRGPMNIGPVDLSAIARSVVAALRQSDPARNVEISITGSATGQGDSRLLRSVLENLLSNAWKFTSRVPNAAIRFSSEVRGDDVVYRVQDNGAGFDMAFAHNLFLPFQRLHSPAEFPGNGIGLATVKRIMGRLGGKVWAEGSVNKGAVFYFTLPRAATRSGKDLFS
jgi:signal transduction histidine kinase